MDTHPRLVEKESLEAIVYRKMGLLINSLWFMITNSLIIFITFIARLVFRNKREDNSQGDGSNSLEKKVFRTLETAPEEPEFEDRNYNAYLEREPSSFSFKFQYQISDDILRKDEEREVPDMKNNIPSSITNVSKCRFLSEKDFSGFMGEPEAMTFTIHESFVHSSTEDIRSEEKLDSHFENKFLSANNFEHQSTEVIAEKASRNSDKYCFNVLDKPLESQDVLVFRKHPLDKGKLEGFETNLLGEKQYKFFPPEFSGFNSDSESSISDGYSVKDLKVDSDFDGFLSEKDFGEHEHESYATGTSSNAYPIELLQDTRKFEEAQLQSLADSDKESADKMGSSFAVNQINYDEFFEDFLLERRFYDPESKLGEKLHEKERKLQTDDQDTEKATNLQCSHSFDTELNGIGDEKFCSEDNKEQPVGNLSHLEEVWSDDECCKAELVLKDLVGGDGKQLQVLKFSETQSSCSSIYDTEAMEDDDDDDDDDGLFSLKNDSFNSKGSDKVLIEKVLLESDSKDKDSDGEDLGRIMDLRNLDEGVKQLETSLLERDSNERKEREQDLKESKKAEMKDLSSDELDEFESLWEHQDLIEQLKIELRKARGICLPTILEESETPKTMDDLKPWKIDEKFLHEDPMDKLHTFYKCYRERMRKFDVLNYQKMYAMGFLQLKNPLQALESQRTTKIASLLSQNLWPFWRRKSSTDPSERFIKELQSDLETVYVGQMCLSWEFLRWQYEKARDLPQSNPYRSHQYNQVAGEFQQFQVVVQRFIENESFQGPRLPNYVKNRSVLQNFLQVPVIREDCCKDKLEERKKGNGVITSEMLEDIMEESIRVFWEFVKADRDETPVILKGFMATNVELQDPSDFELMADAQEILLKKEKKLKDILKTGNCLVRKFKKPQEDRSNQDLFFSQVDLKLVARVLRMSRITTDQLAWSHNKLSKITFIDRKIQREPSFFLFPC